MLNLKISAWFLLALYCFINPSIVLRQDSAMKVYGAPIFLDSNRFTADWTNNITIRQFYSSLAKRKDNAVLEYYFTVLKNGALNLQPSRYERFVKGFVNYKWSNIVRNRDHPYDRNVKLTLSFLPVHNKITMQVEILDAYKPDEHILKYKKVYLKEITIKD